jgi:hypothetical protein
MIMDNLRLNVAEAIQTDIPAECPMRTFINTKVMELVGKAYSKSSFTQM